MRFLTAGGLGDAVISYGKVCFDKNAHLIHVHRNGILTKEIDEFYAYQNLSHEVIVADFDWGENNKNKWDKELAPYWHGKEDGLEINPFPKLNYKKVDVDIVLSPFAGQRRNRIMDIGELEKLIEGIGNRKITYIGSGRKVDDLDDIIKRSNGVNLISQTSLTEAVDIICSTNSIIAPEGFVIYMGGIARRKTFAYNHNITAIHDRGHPDWKIKIFDNLSELIKLI